MSIALAGPILSLQVVKLTVPPELVVHDMLTLLTHVTNKTIINGAALEHIFKYI